MNCMDEKRDLSIRDVCIDVTVSVALIASTWVTEWLVDFLFPGGAPVPLIWILHARDAATVLWVVTFPIRYFRALYHEVNFTINHIRSSGLWKRSSKKFLRIRSKIANTWLSMNQISQQLMFLLIVLLISSEVFTMTHKTVFLSFPPIYWISAISLSYLLEFLSKGKFQPKANYWLLMALIFATLILLNALWTASPGDVSLRNDARSSTTVRPNIIEITPDNSRSLKFAEATSLPVNSKIQTMNSLPASVTLSITTTPTANLTLSGFVRISSFSVSSRYTAYATSLVLLPSLPPAHPVIASYLLRGHLEELPIRTLIPTDNNTPVVPKFRPSNVPAYVEGLSYRADTMWKSTPRSSPTHFPLHMALESYANLVNVSFSLLALLLFLFTLNSTIGGSWQRAKAFSIAPFGSFLQPAPPLRV